MNLQVGPGGDLFYVDFDGGTVRRTVYTSSNQAPVAVATATPTTGSAPLTVSFDGTGSSDPDAGDALSFAWDLDGDGAFDDSGHQPTYTYTNSGAFTATLRVTDPGGATSTDAVVISVGNTLPPLSSRRLPPEPSGRSGTSISFSGSCDRRPGRHTAADGPVLGPAPAALPLELSHACAAEHPQTASGSFVAPDHEAPAYLELR